MYPIYNCFQVSRKGCDVKNLKNMCAENVIVLQPDFAFTYSNIT